MHNTFQEYILTVHMHSHACTYTHIHTHTHTHQCPGQFMGLRAKVSFSTSKEYMFSA